MRTEVQSAISIRRLIAVLACAVVAGCTVVGEPGVRLADSGIHQPSPEGAATVYFTGTWGPIDEEFDYRWRTWDWYAFGFVNLDNGQLADFGLRGPRNFLHDKSATLPDGTHTQAFRLHAAPGRYRLRYVGLQIVDYWSYGKSIKAGFEFTVEAGDCVYLGRLKLTPLLEPNLSGRLVARNIRIDVGDRLAEDKSIIATRFPSGCTGIESRIIAPASDP
jgi:hypothetical protein